MDAVSAARSTKSLKKADYHFAVSEFIDEIRLYEVVQGEQRMISLGRKELENLTELSCEGYISGVEVISPSERLTASIEDRALNILAADVQPPTKAPATNVAGEQFSAGPQFRYAYFPKVPGDTVSMTDFFPISIEGEAGGCSFQVRQNGYQHLATIRENALSHRNELIFRYLGEDPPRVRNSLNDLEERLNAISDGIEAVEKAVGERLVSCVNILQYHGVDNALTSWGKDQIWIYADTLGHQTIAELRSMAEHETLHLFVDREEFTRKTAIRRYFSDLRGFGTLSLERFSIVTRGTLPQGATSPPGEMAPFFAFINEKNFISGMSGGHSGDNLDEFCTSFLHALLYHDRFQENFENARLVLSDGSIRSLSLSERKTILHDFRGALNAFIISTMEDTPLPSLCYSRNMLMSYVQSVDDISRFHGFE